jgi:hypothetical protein
MSGETVRGQRDQQHLPTGTTRCFTPLDIVKEGR